MPIVNLSAWINFEIGILIFLKEKAMKGILL